MGQGHGTPLGHGQQFCEILSRSKKTARSYSPDMDFRYVCSDIDLEDMTLSQGHDTLLGNRQQFCEILSISNKAVRSYCLDTDFWYVCTVTLTLEI